MEYNQYWNEIKGIDDNGNEKREDNTPREDVVSFTYNTVPEEPKETNHGGLISPDAYEYLDNTSEDELLHDAMIDEENLFDSDDEETVEESDEEDDSKMYSNSSLFDLIDEIEEQDEAEKAEKLDEARFISFDFKDDDYKEENEDDVHIFADDLGSALDEDEVEEPVVEEPMVEEPVAEEPVEEKKEETDIDKLILEAKKKEEETSQNKLMNDSDLLPLLKDIISFMPASCGFVDYIARLSNDDRKDLVRFIDQAKNAWLKNKSDKMFTIAEGELSICILSDVSDPMRDVQRMETVGAQMFSYEKESWNFVKLYFDDEGQLLRAETQLINKDSFNSWQWRVVQQSGYNLWKSRQ